MTKVRDPFRRWREGEEEGNLLEMTKQKAQKMEMLGEDWLWVWIQGHIVSIFFWLQKRSSQAAQPWSADI